MEFDALSNQVVGCAIEVHRELGPGLLESTCEQCLACELGQTGIGFKLQQALPVQYKGLRLDCGYRVDVLVQDMLILERKSVDQLQRPASEVRYQALRPLTLRALRVLRGGENSLDMRERY